MSDLRPPVGDLPPEAFRQYLTDNDVSDPAVAALFDELLSEVSP